MAALPIRFSTLVAVLSIAALALPGCSSCGDEAPGDGVDTGVQVFDSGAGADGATQDGSAGADGGDGAVNGDVGGGDGGGPSDRGPVDSGADPNNPNNERLDSDCDGLSDAYEFGTLYPNGMRTDPGNPDSDGDGLPDGLETAATSSISGSGCPMLQTPDADPATRTSPVDPDSDADGIGDGLEDRNRNGRLDADESNPTSRDTDGDQLSDSVEDRNRDGVRDATETHPGRRDSDGDGIADGVEDRDRDGTRQATETDPVDADTDGDNLDDGEEDTNHDGSRQPTETDPLTPDSDCDGVSDGDEMTMGTSPLLDDSDGDGVIDGVEAGRTTVVPGSNCPGFTGDQDPTTMTDPRVADSDMDGVPDGLEDANGNGRVDMGEIDPRDSDSDNDGIPDGDERLSGTNPLDPNSPNADQRSGVAAVCLDGVLKVVDFDQNGRGDWTVANEQSSTYTAVTVNAADVFAAILDDNTSRWSAFVTTMPLLGGAAANATGQVTALNARLSAAAAGLNLAITPRQSARVITTHDNLNAAVSGVLDVNVTGGLANSSQLRNLLLRAATGLGAAAFSGLTTNIGSNTITQYTATYSIVVRPATMQVVVVMAVLDRTAYDSATNPASLFLNDLTNGTSIAVADARRNKACNAFSAAGQSVADFIWMADISVSTDDDRGRIASAAQLVFNALANNGVDFRMGVVPHSENEIIRGAGMGGNLRGTGFTRDALTFVGYMNDTSSSDGCEFGLEAVRNTITRALPRTPIGMPENSRRVREGATLAVVYVSDEFAQELTEGQCGFDPGGAACNTGVGDAFSAGPGDAVCTLVPNATQQACISQILSPYLAQLRANDAIAFAQTFDPNPPGQCNQGQFVCPQPGSYPRNEPGRGYVDMVQSTGGVFYSPCVDNPGSALQAIVDAVSGAASQFQLTNNPISASIKVGITRQGTGMTTIVPRDKQNGFDYDPVSNSIFFRGATFRPNNNDRVTISYRIWLPPEAPCGMACGNNQICDGQLGVCTCDQAQCAATCTANQVCDANCNCACAPDCNGQCAGASVCNTTTCQCQCPADCGGCPSGTVCNPTTCACECDASCGGACAGTNLECNTGACNCQCPSDCGGGCSQGTVCNTSTCECACDPACNTACNGNARCDPSQNCACVCPQDCGGCPDQTVCNPTSCTCDCPTGCSQACPNRQVCDPNNGCGCYCPTDCGGCPPNETCDQTNCICRPIV
jgi:hypothetical protein